MSFPLEKINCDKVYLRNIDISDAEAIFDIYSDAEVTRFLDFPVMKDVNHAENFIDDVLLGYLNGDLLEWAIIENKKDTFIGTIHFAQWDYKHGHAKIGFALNKNWWGRGIMKDLLSPFIQFGFKELRLNRIQANINPLNNACKKLFEERGFQREGLLRERYMLLGQPHDIIIFSLLKNESELVI